jgi:DNA mismatch repair protein MutS
MPTKRKQTVKSKGLDYATKTEKEYFALYDENKAKYGSQVAVLYLVGRFYEVYDYVEKTTGISRTNVEKLVELCGTVVEHKPCTDSTYDRLFWGFPMDSLHKFERLLVSAGYSVVVYTQEKNSIGDVVGRPFDHVSSPGTFLDDDGIAIRKEEQCLLCVYVEPWTSNFEAHWSVSTTAFDISTGLCESTEAEIQLIDGKPVLDCLVPFWNLHPPAEILWISTEPPSKKEDILSYTSIGYVPLIHTLQVDKKDNNTEKERLRLAFLQEIYPQTGLSIQEYLGISHYPQIKRSLCNLLQFMKEHNRSYLQRLTTHTVWNPEEQMLLGNAALQQLGMLPLNNPQDCLLFWLQKAETAMGRRVLRERLLKPIADITELEERQNRISEYRANRNPGIQINLRGMCDLQRLYRRFQLRSASFPELLALTTTYKKILELFQLLDISEPIFYTHINILLDSVTIERIRGTIDGHCHPWKHGIYKDLDDYEEQWNKLEQQMNTLREKWNTILDENDAIKWIVREEEPFTFVATQRRSTVLTNACKNVTARKNGNSKSEYLLETAEICEANKKAVIIRNQWTMKIQAYFNEFMETLITSVPPRFVKAIGTIDAEYTLASISEKYGYVRPVYRESSITCPSGINVSNLRHPIIERLTTTTYIPHNLSLGLPSDEAYSDCGILLYGVNAAGKSSLGKALGLAVLMAQAGMPVPASEMTLIPYTSLFTRILGNDNLWAGMSSFVVEMTEFRSILRAAGPRTLVIGDELCAGTETASATSIVAAGIEYLADKNTHFLFATHLHELGNIIKSPKIKAYHLSVHIDITKNSLVYDRKLKIGQGSPMYGLEVCRGLDMDDSFLAKAFYYRKKYFENTAPSPSRYNSSLIVDKCAICGSKDNLETHHIVPQANAKNGAATLGTPIHHISNLVPLCDDCHTKHHQGLYEISGWSSTSEGRVLIFKKIE